MKIVNVASGDDFKDILESVRESESSRVILIVPRSNRIFKSKNKIEQLKSHFEKLNKDVSIISSGSEIVKNAKLAGFNILQEASITKEKENDITSLYEEKLPEEKEIKDIKKNSQGKSPILKNVGHFFRQLNSIGTRKFILIFLSVALISFVLIIFGSLTEARIKIVPRKNNFSVNIPLTVSNQVSETDPVYGMIPGEFIQFEKVISKTFLSSGEKEVFQKAKGRITIYNNFSSSPQIFVATTRFQTPEGLVFRIPKAVSVPGAQKIGESLKPSEIEVEVIADRAGEDYNIESSEFKIPGLLGSPKYGGFYAKSFEKFSGGFIGKANFVTKDDFEKAESSLKQEMLDKIKTELASLSGFKTLDEALDIEETLTLDSNKVQDLVREFKLGIKAKVKTMAFKEIDIVDFISQYVRNSQNLDVLEKSIKTSYNEPRFNEKNQELSLKLISSGQTVENIDEEKIVSEILGKKGAEIKNYVNSLKGVESAQILLSPFWVQSVPKNQERVKIEIIVE